MKCCVKARAGLCKLWSEWSTVAGPQGNFQPCNKWIPWRGMNGAVKRLRVQTIEFQSE